MPGMPLCLGSQETKNGSQICWTRPGLGNPKLLDIQALLGFEELRAESEICVLRTESTPGQGKGNSDSAQWCLSLAWLWLWLEAQIGLLWEA